LDNKPDDEPEPNEPDEDDLKHPAAADPNPTADPNSESQRDKASVHIGLIVSEKSDIEDDTIVVTLTQKKPPPKKGKGSKWASPPGGSKG